MTGQRALLAVACIAAAGAVFAAGAVAQRAPELKADGRVLTLQAAVAAAVRGHPSLGSARARVRRAGEGINAARAGYFPSVSFGVNSRLSGDTVPDESGNSVNDAQLNASQLVYGFGRVGSEIDRAEAQRRRAKTQVQQAYAEVVRNTANAWIQVRRFKALVPVAEDRLDAVQALAELAQQREELGASSHSESAQAQARVAAARAELLVARSQVRRWRTSLMHWVGARVPPRVSGKPAPSVMHACRSNDRNSDKIQASQQAVAVRLARAELTLARAAEDVAATRMRPALRLNATTSQSLNSSSQRFGGDRTDLAVTLDFSMPFYQGGALRADRRAAEYAVQAAQAALEQALLATKRDLQNAILQWHRFRDLREVQQLREHSMRVTRELYRKQYLKLGTRSLLDLLNAEQEYYGVLSEQVESKYTMYRLGITCLFHTGGLHDAFETDDEAPPNIAPGKGLIVERRP